MDYVQIQFQSPRCKVGEKIDVMRTDNEKKETTMSLVEELSQKRKEK